MRLLDWLGRERMTRRDFACRVGVSPSDMTGICRGTQWVSAKTALAIERETQGEVTVADILGAYRENSRAVAAE